MAPSFLFLAARMRIALTDYSSLEEVLGAVRMLPYEGGARKMGAALQFLVRHVFSAAISRDHAPKVLRDATMMKYNAYTGEAMKGHPFFDSKKKKKSALKSAACARRQLNLSSDKM